MLSTHNNGANDLHVPAYTIAKTPSVTLNMVIDSLRECELVYKPKATQKMFRWVICVRDENCQDFSDFGSDLLFLCNADRASQLTAQGCFPPSSTLVIFANEDKVPAWLEESGWHARSLVVYARQGDCRSYARTVENLFLATCIWETEMDRIVYVDGLRGRRGSLNKLISVSATALDSFLCITDTGFNVIAYSDEVEPPNAVYERLVRDGCFDKQEIARIKHDVLPKASPKRATIVCKANDHNSHASLHAPFFIDDSYLFHFTMACPPDRYIDALVDVFDKFMTRASSICLEFWKNQVEVESTYHRVLIGMINGKKMSREYIETQLELTTIPKARRFRLLRYHLDPKLPYAKNREISKAAATLNNGNCYPFIYDSDLLILCYSLSRKESDLSLNKTLEETSEVMFRPFGIPASASQPFSNVKDINFAYRQTTTALKMRKMLAKVYPSGYDGNGSFPLFPFEHVLQFLIMGDSVEPDLISFSFRNSVLSDLVREDAETGANFMPLLWEYLCAELNASETAKRMNVHRNTVVYHINKFESRFDISLGMPMVRHRLLLDFLHHYRHST